MKSLLAVTTRKAAAILGVATLMAIPVLAQQNNWKIDDEHSTAAIYLGSNSDLQNIGIARVGGDAELNPAEPAKSELNVSARLRPDQWMTFQSKRIELRADGNLQVTGEMMLVRIERDATYNPGEDYRGPAYGEPAIETASREMTFILPQVVGQKGEITAEATLGIENFPELFAAVHQAAWKPLVEDEACEIPQAGEDYRGAECSGTLIAPEYRLAALNPGEDYRGDESPAPSGKLMKVVLRLQLKAA
jgi:hypothetical protein